MKTDRIWKNIPGFTYYQASNDGLIRKIEHLETYFVDNSNNTFQRVRKEKIIKQRIRNNYYVVSLSGNGKHSTYQVNRLVAMAFLPNDDLSLVVNHLDYNTFNNKVENLEWCTCKENTNYSQQHMCHSKRSKSKHQYIRLKNNRYELTIRKKYIGTYNNLEEAIIARNKEIENEKEYFAGRTF